MSYYPQPDSYSTNKIKVKLHLLNFTIKKELDHAKGVNNFDLPAKKGSVALKAEVGKLDINKMVR